MLDPFTRLAQAIVRLLVDGSRRPFDLGSLWEARATTIPAWKGQILVCGETFVSAGYVGADAFAEREVVGV